MKVLKVVSLSAVAAGLIAFGQVRAEEGAHHGVADEIVTLKGEVLDMACYLDHGAQGEKHAECARKCITSGLPVGIKADNGKTYLLIGDHKPANSELAEYAGKTITVKGKATSRDGINMLENAEIVK